jgi:hypothetical protein
MTRGSRQAVLTAVAIALAPIVIVAMPRAGERIAYVVPMICFPIPVLLAARWPSPWSAATLGAFVATLGVVWLATRRAGSPSWWRGALPLAGLSLAGWALLVASFALLGSGLIALIWSGIAVAVWNGLLMLQIRGVRPGLSQAALCVWLIGGMLCSLYAAVFGVMTGLCC